MASSVPPATPAKALIWCPPKVSKRASVVLPPASWMTCTWSAMTSAKSPSTCTKPKASMSMWPLTCSSSPRRPSRLRARVLAGPVATSNSVAPSRKSTKVPSRAARLMATDTPSAATVKPSTPTKAASPTLACTLVQLRAIAGVSTRSVLSTMAKSTSAKFRPKALA